VESGLRNRESEEIVPVMVDCTDMDWRYPLLLLEQNRHAGPFIIESEVRYLVTDGSKKLH